ncbi:MAG: SAM-dependent DNA methyltransferase [Planctomycetota bacterium]|nr:SAM-dependent DNA methyltransferase [Planctomycetota bacterium]
MSTLERQLEEQLIAPSVTNPRQRIIDHGEVFTPPELVNHMLDLVAQECERVDSRFLEPACGDGNFLAEVLRRKLLTVDKRHARNRENWERDAILSVCSLYGIDLMADNITACRDRLLNVVCDSHVARFNAPLPERAACAATYILSQNIVQGDALHMRTAEDSPIIFPEWSPLGRARLKRRDYAYDELAGQNDFALSSQVNDFGQRVFPPPKPIADYPPCHYLKVAEQAEERR